MPKGGLAQLHERGDDFFKLQAAEKGTCIVLRLWNQGGKDRENEEVMEHIEKFVPKPWKERPDGLQTCQSSYLEFDRKIQNSPLITISEKEMIKEIRNQVSEKKKKFL